MTGRMEIRSGTVDATLLVSALAAAASSVVMSDSSTAVSSAPWLPLFVHIRRPPVQLINDSRCAAAANGKRKQKERRKKKYTNQHTSVCVLQLGCLRLQSPIPFHWRPPPPPPAPAILPDSIPPASSVSLDSLALVEPRLCPPLPALSLPPCSPLSRSSSW